jgi:uncharacterized protein YjgD (DUF1641 family)
LNNNQTTKLLIGIATALAVFSLIDASAQIDEVTVPAVNGTPVEVPTAAQAAENATYSIIGLITAIIAIIGLIVKSGILDSILSAKRKTQILGGSEAVLVALQKALENKILIRKSYEIAFSSAPEDKKSEYAKLIQNMDEQIKATTAQIQFYSDHFPMKVNPDSNRALPREGFNIATKRLINDTFTEDHGTVT